MIIDFDKIAEQIVPNFKGGEKEYHVRTYVDEHNRIMRGRLHPGATIGYHKHETNSEIYYILRGTGYLLTDSGEEIVEAGQAHYCRPGESHSLQNRGESDLEFIAIVAEH